MKLVTAAAMCALSVACAEPPQDTYPLRDVAAPPYEISKDAIDDSDGMRIVFVGTVDNIVIGPSQQRAIVSEIVKDEPGKNRWVRVFIEHASQGDKGSTCREVFNAGAILECDFSR